jgi:hypothetical protein
LSPYGNSGRRFGIHCIDAAKELPLIRRDLDRFTVLTIDRRARCRDIDGELGDSGADRDFRRQGTGANDEQEMSTRHDRLLFS